MLGDTEVSYGDQTKLPGMGISKWAALLVYQWDHLPGRGATKLAREDEDVPTVQSIQIDVASPMKARV